MRILSFETSCGKLSVSLDDGNTIFTKEETLLNQQSKLLFTLINEILKEHNLTTTELDSIVISNGPGSFTGVRIGIAAAIGMQVGAGVQLYNFSTLQCLASQKPGHKLVSLRSSNDSFYTQEFDGNTPINDIIILSAQELSELDIEHYGHFTDESIMPHSRNLIDLYRNASEAELMAAKTIAPLYVRRPYF